MWLQPWLIVIETYLSILHCNVANLRICTPSETIWHFDCTDKSWQKSTFILATMVGLALFCCYCYCIVLGSLPYNNYVNWTKWEVWLRGKQWLWKCIILEWYAFIVENDFHHIHVVLLFSVVKLTSKRIYDQVEPFLHLMVIMALRSSSFEFNVVLYLVYYCRFNLFVCVQLHCILIFTWFKAGSWSIFCFPSFLTLSFIFFLPIYPFLLFSVGSFTIFLCIPTWAITNITFLF